MTIEGFWSKPPDYGRNRESDPLGLSTVHEAAADVLLPFISGRTRRAHDYLWVLVGLQWAGGDDAATDGEIWERFEVFEKALKLNWYHRGRRGFTGVNAVGDQYVTRRTDLEFKLVSNQRSQGLLGTYLRSLREGDLVDRRSLRLSDSGRALIDRAVPLRWSGEISSYGWLARTFERAQQGFVRSVLRDLGKALFDPEPMRDVATAIRSLGGRPAWRTAALRLAASEGKQLVAGIGNHFARFARRVTDAFWSMLESPNQTVTQLEVGGLKTRGWRDVVFRSVGLQPFREPFDRFLIDVQRRPRYALIDLHNAVWARRGHTVPWMRVSNGRINVRRDIALKAPPAEREWDLRWTVAHELIRQTRWRPR